MKTYKDDGVASDDLSIVQSPDEFHEGDQYAGREKTEERSSMRLSSGM